MIKNALAWAGLALGTVVLATGALLAAVAWPAVALVAIWLLWKLVTND